MAGFITAEGLVVPAGADTYDYVNDQRRLAGSIRSVSPVANAAAAATIASAMSTDGRPVSDTNPLVTWDATLKQLVTYNGGATGFTSAANAAVVVDANWTPTGQLTRVTGPDGKQTVNLAVRMQRAGSGFTIATTYVAVLTGFAPAGFVPAATANGWALLTDGADAPLATIWWRITTSGDLQARLDSGSTTFATGNRMHLSLNWTTT